MIIIGLGLAVLAACSTSMPDSPLPAGSLLIGSSTAPKNPQEELFYAQRTQEVASVALTEESVSGTQVAQSTDSVVRLTQVELELRLTAGAATSDAQATRAVGTATQAYAMARDTAVAGETADARQTAAAVAAVTTSARSTQAVYSATATAVQAGLDSQTQEVTTWGPIIFVGVLAATLIVFAWRLMGIFEARTRVIAQPNGAPLIIQEQRASLQQHLPSFLRWIAWFIETQQVIVDQEKNLYPVTVIGPDVVTAPRLTDDDRQERVTRRRQFTQTAAVLAAEKARAAALALAGGQEAAIDDGPGIRPAGDYEIVDPGQFNAWLGEVKLQLSPGSAHDEEEG